MSGGARCKMCGAPLDQVPFEPCPEHAIHAKLVDALSDTLAGLPTLENKRLAAQEAFDNYAYDDIWENN